MGVTTVSEVVSRRSAPVGAFGPDPTCERVVAVGLLSRSTWSRQKSPCIAIAGRVVGGGRPCQGLESDEGVGEHASPCYRRSLLNGGVDEVSNLRC